MGKSNAGADYQPGAAETRKKIKYHQKRGMCQGRYAAQAPAFNTADAEAFMATYKSFLGNSSELPVLVAAKKLMTLALGVFLSLPDSFSTRRRPGCSDG